MDNTNNSQLGNNTGNNEQIENVGNESIGGSQEMGNIENDQQMRSVENSQQVGFFENGQQVGSVENGRQAEYMNNQAMGDIENVRHGNRRLCYAALGALAVLVVVGLVVILMMAGANGPGGGSDDGGDGGDVATVPDDASETSRKPFMDLTKEEAMAAYLEMQKPGYVPEGYISDIAVPTNGCEAPQTLPLFSYTNKDDVGGIYDDSAFATIGALDKVEFVQDYYAVAFSVPYEYGAAWADDGTALGCLRAFSFNKQYYDYSEGSSMNGVFVDTSAEFIKIALPILATLSGETAQLSNIYSYDFEEDDGGITLNIHELGLGYDADYSDLDAYKERVESGELTKALQFNTVKYRYDNSTKQADWVRDCDECVFGVKIERTIPLGEDEVETLYVNN